MKNNTLYKIILKLLPIAILIFPANLFGFNSGAKNFKWSTIADGNNIIATVTIPANYYLYKKFTTVELKTKSGNSIKAKEIPNAIEHTDELGTKQIIYPEGTHKWIFNLSKTETFKIQIKYQGCSQKPFACYPPNTITKKISLKIPDKINNNNITTGKKESISNKNAITPPTQNNMSNSYLGEMIKKGGIWIFLVALLGGLFSVFTPCVLPLLPITIAILGAGKNAKKQQAFKRSFFYVIGIIITFTTLAIFASLSGRAFGTALLSNPTILLIFAIFFILMSFSLLGMYDLHLPNSWNNSLNKFGGGTDLGAFFMGLVAGFIAIPCTGPILATLLGISAASGNILFGSSLLFVYSLGFGIPFFIVGIGLVKAPKSGAYMDTVKSFLGVIILILAIYIVTIAVPTINIFLSTPSNILKATALLLIIVGVLLGAFHSDGHSLKKSVKYLKIIGAVITALGIVWILKIPVGTSEHKLEWNTNLQQSFVIAKKKQKPLILDFTADWCSACKELEAMTFSNQKISNKLKNNWILARVDATTDSKELRSVLQKYKVLGFPTVIFFSPSGKELNRFSGFIPPDKFSKFLK
jgi:thioredoxin:protein disulfide reductase